MKSLSLIRKSIKSICVIFLFFSVSISVSAQEGTVLTMNSDKEKQTIFIKWYIEEVICEEGVNIYRKKSREETWKKINKEPYKYTRPIPNQYFEKDSSLKEFVEIINETPKEELKSIILLNVLLKSIQSDVYAKYLGLFYEDNTVVTGEKYSYKVMKINKGREQLIGISSEITTGNFTPDIPPQDIKITASINKADMVWKPELQRYYAIDIYRSSSINNKEIQLNHLPIMLSQKTEEDGTKTIPEPYFSDDSLINDVTYYYRFVAQDYFGRNTKSSDTISVFIKDLVPPLPPYNLHSDQDNFKTTLIWKINETDDLFGFNVYKSLNDSIYEKINENLLPETDTSFLDIAETDGIFFYYVTALDKDNNEARSPKLMVEIPDIIPPEKPEALTAKADTGIIKLIWNENTDEDLLGYIIYRRIAEKKNKEFVPLIADPVRENKFTDIYLSKTVKNYFQYTVAAVDSSYNVSELSNIVSAQMPDILPPHKPKFKKTHLSNKGVVVEWIPNLEPDLAAYNIFRKEKKDSTNYKKLNKELLSPHLHQYTDINTQSGKVYYYKLTAIDSSGNTSHFSAPFLGAIKKPEYNDSSTFKRLSVKYNKQKKAVKIKWKVLEEETYKGCVIYKKEEGKAFKPLTGLIKKKEHFDTEISEGITYYYQVRIYENNGKVFKSDITEIAIEKQ